MKQNSRTNVVIVCVTMVFIALFVFCSPTKEVVAAEKKVFNWKFSSHVPAGSKGLAVVQAWYCEEIEKRSNGLIKIKIFWQDELCGAKEMMVAVRSRLAEVVGNVPSYTPGEIPIMNVTILPFICTPRIDQAVAVNNRLAKESKPFIDEMNKFNCVWGGSYVSEGYNIMGKKPVRTVDDLKGLRMRTLPELGDILKEFGASPMSVPVTEMYSALSTGMVDVVSHERLTFNTYKIDEISNYLTLDIDMNLPNTMFLINKDAWNELPDNLKKVIQSVIDDLPAFSFDFSRRPDRNLKAQKVIEERGIEVIHFPKSERDKLVAKAERIWDNWAKRSGKYEVAKKALADFIRIRDETVAKYPQGVPYVHYKK